MIQSVNSMTQPTTNLLFKNSTNKRRNPGEQTRSKTVSVSVRTLNLPLPDFTNILNVFTSKRCIVTYFTYHALHSGYDCLNPTIVSLEWAYDDKTRFLKWTRLKYSRKLVLWCRMLTLITDKTFSMICCCSNHTVYLPWCVKINSNLLILCEVSTQVDLIIPGLGNENC